MLDGLLYLMTSFWLGAAHAATPGHGKTIAASYIVGVRGRPVDALVLGVFVTLSHTSGIILVAVLASLGSAWLIPQRVEAYLAVGTGLLVIAIGAWMLRAQLSLLSTRDEVPAGQRPLQDGETARGDADEPSHAHEDSRAYDPDARGASHNQEHGRRRHEDSHTSGSVHPDEAPHTHEHSHAHEGPHTHEHPSTPEHRPNHEHSHSHEDPDTRPHTHEHAHALERQTLLHRHGWGRAHTHDIEALARSRPSLPMLLGLGIAGGLLPDPGALAILLSAIASGRLMLGLLTVVVFSLGFAFVLVLVGVVAAGVGRLVLDWLHSRWVRWVQVGAAVVILAVGLVLTVNAWRVVTTLG